MNIVKLLCYMMLVLAPVALLNAAQPENELARFALVGYRLALDELDTVDVSFIMVGTQGAVKSEIVDFLASANYNDILPYFDKVAGQRGLLEGCVLSKGLYRKKQGKEYFDYRRQFLGAKGQLREEQVVLGQDVSKNWSVAYRPLRGMAEFFPHNEYALSRCVHTEPGVLFSSRYVMFCGAGEPYAEIQSYAGMFEAVDTSGARLEDSDCIELVVTKHYDASDRESVDTLLLDADNFLPRAVEIGRTEGLFYQRFEVDGYLRMNGAVYPRGGRYLRCKDGDTKSTAYFFIDESSAKLNTQVPDEEMEIALAPGTEVFNRFLQTTFIVE